MGLNEGYKSIRNHVLSMKLLSIANKAYCLEQITFSDSTEVEVATY